MTSDQNAELAKFGRLAERWWDTSGEMRPLHDINPLRTDFIDRRAPLAGKRVLDVGCGAGILSEALAQRGAQVTGLDLSPELIEAASAHAADSDLAIDYRCVASRDLAREMAGAFDIVVAYEMLEHVDEPAHTVEDSARLTAPGGDLFFSTTVLDIEDEDHGISVLTNQGRIEAELIVHTAGWNLTEYLPWSRDKLYPVRLQHLKARSTDIQLSGPMVLQYGHSWARPLGDGKISTGGCRWATPHLEIGENDDEHTSEVVESKILNRAHALFSPEQELDISERWAQIATFTCDGLPFVGTLPGTARQLVCTGWNARPWSMALAAGEMVASAICDESSDELPRCIGSYRMI